jgi:ADP-ribose pyrophosphatase YjhB (NUDIX family)
MNIWRPSSSIRVKALGLAWRDTALLASEVLDDHGAIKGVRPLGGTVEFGETWQSALKREFREELGAEIELSGTSDVLENIYKHHDAIGHEVIFISPIIFLDKSFYLKDEIIFTESNGVECRAAWFELDDLANGELELFPKNLRAMLNG